MKLQLKADSRQWMLVDADRLAGDEPLVLGYYSTLESAIKSAFQILLKSKSKRARDIEKACAALDKELQAALEEIDALSTAAIGVIEQLKHDSELLTREKAVRSRKSSG